MHSLVRLIADALGARVPRGSGVVVGVSGGMDSVALVHALARLRGACGFTLAVAHVNYRLRGAAADEDEAFVRRLAADLGASVHVARPEPGAEGDSVQAVARRQRYGFFAEVARAVGSRHVAVAHHQGDQAETVLLNLARGAGPEGLAGMPAARPLAADPEVTLVRPLLSASREAIRAFAEAEGLAWRTDATNRDPDAYRRNAVRHRVLPALEADFPGATGRLAHAAEVMRGHLRHTFAPALDARWADVCAGAKRTLAAEALRTQPAVWRRRLILEALARWLPEAPHTDAFAAEVEALLDAQVGRRVEASGGAVWRVRAGLRFVTEAEAPAPRPAAAALRWGQSVPTPAGRLRADLLAAPPPTLDPGTPRAAYADADRLGQPLTVRPWRPGDRLRPLGLDGTKLVSDLLTDARVPPPERAAVVVVLAADGTVAWVAGHRLAHAVRVRPTTRRVARLALEEGGGDAGAAS